MSGDILTDRKYHPTILVWKNIVQSVKLFLPSCLSLITAILICAGVVTLNGFKNIGQRLMGRKRLITLSSLIKKETQKNLKRVKQLEHYRVHLSAQVVAKLEKWMDITLITQSHLRLFGYADNVTLLFIGKKG